MGTFTCDNLRCQARLAAGARFCPRCGTSVANAAWPRGRRRRRRLFRLPMILTLVAIGLVTRSVQHRKIFTPAPQSWPPALLPAKNVGPDAPVPANPLPAFSSSPTEGLPPFAVTLGPTLQRFEIARVGWHASAQAWGTPAVFWADLRPVRAGEGGQMPGVLLAWCYGPDPTLIKRATAEWGTDAAGPVLHVWVDFTGLEHPFARLRIGAA